MKHLKMLGLAATAAMVLMALATGTASATTLEVGASHPSTIDASLVGTATLQTTGGTILNTCTSSTILGTPTTGGVTQTVKVPVSKENITVIGCTNTSHFTQGGELEIHHIAGTENGTVTGTGFEVTVFVFGTSCTYGLGTGSVHLGPLTSANTTILHIDTVFTEQTGDQFLCPNDARWVGTYHITTPNYLVVTAG